MKIPALARVLPLAIAAQWCACAQSQITVVVFDYAGTPHSMLVSAVETARRGFHAAGVESQWVICEAEHCGEALPDAPSLELFVMPRQRTQLKASLVTHPAGYAMLGGFPHPRAYAFFDAAKSVADRTTRPVDIVLACILLHETGHLLGLKHQPDGVMRANLEAADMDRTAMGRAFNPWEGKALRAAVAKTLGCCRLGSSAAHR